MYLVNYLVFEKEEFMMYNLENMPVAGYYEKSYMHKDIVDSVISATDTDFIITTSLDGVLKFWKKNYIGIEFIKQYKAHSGRITGLSVSNTSTYLCSCSPKDESLKLYDIINFDMINFIKFSFLPNLCCFINKKNDPVILMAVSEKDSGNIHIVKGDSKGEIYKTVKIHEVQVTSLKYNLLFHSVISSDINGLIEYWNPDTLGIFY